MDQEIKDKIVVAASSYFFTYGYSAISMDSISDSLGMSKKTLYTIFTGKYDLLIHVVEYLKKDLSTSIDAILSNESYDFKKKLREMMGTIGKYLSKISPDFIADLQKNLPEVWESLKHYKMEAAYLRFNKLITEGIKSGYISKDVNKSIAVALYACAIQSLFDDRFLVQLPDSIRMDIPKQASQLFDGIISILFDGIIKVEAINEVEKTFGI